MAIDDLIVSLPIAEVDNPSVITGTLEGKALSDLQPFWQRLGARAGVKDVRNYDLRHTDACYLRKVKCAP